MAWAIPAREVRELRLLADRVEELAEAIPDAPTDRAPTDFEVGVLTARLADVAIAATELAQTVQRLIPDPDSPP